MKAWLIYNKTTDEYRGYKHGTKWLWWGPREKAKVYDKFSSAKAALHCTHGHHDGPWYDAKNDKDVIVVQEIEITETIVAEFIVKKERDDDEWSEKITLVKVEA